MLEMIAWLAASGPTVSNHVLENHPSAQPQHKAGAGAQKPAGDAVTPPQQRTRNPAEQQTRTAKDQRDRDQTERIVQDADVRHRKASFLSFVPSSGAFNTEHQQQRVG